MKNIQCKNCGNPSLQLIENEYICQACGSKYKVSDFAPATHRGSKNNNSRTLSSNEKEELKRLKAALKEDPSLSLAKRILELAPNDWEAYQLFYHSIWNEHANYTFEGWLVCLQKSGLSVAEIEAILAADRYEPQLKNIKKIFDNFSAWIGRIDLYYSSDPDHTYDEDADRYIKDADSYIKDIEKEINFTHKIGIPIIAILGNTYSPFVNKWESFLKDICIEIQKEIKEIKEIKKEVLKNFFQKRKERKEKKEERLEVSEGWSAVIMLLCCAFILSLALCLVFYFSKDMSLETLLIINIPFFSIIILTIYFIHKKGKLYEELKKEAEKYNNELEKYNNELKKTCCNTLAIRLKDSAQKIFGDNCERININKQ